MAVNHDIKDFILNFWNWVSWRRSSTAIKYVANIAFLLLVGNKGENRTGMKWATNKTL